MGSNLPGFDAAARDLAAIGKRFYARGWVMGTSGNFSSVITRDPVMLAMTASSVHKGTLTEDQVLVVDDRGVAVAGTAQGLRPSAECLLHTEIVKVRGAGAVLHTHSIWSTILSEHFAARGAVEIEGYEMLKGFAGINTHESRELVPIIDNDQNIERLAGVMSATLVDYPASHAVLLRKHGIYTWGATLVEAERHIEIVEFLLEAVGRSLLLRTHEGNLWHS